MATTTIKYLLSLTKKGIQKTSEIIEGKAFILTYPLILFPLAIENRYKENLVWQSFNGIKDDNCYLRGKREEVSKNSLELLLLLLQSNFASLKINTHKGRKRNIAKRNRDCF